MKRVLQNVSVFLALLVAFSACELDTSPDDLQKAGITVGDNVNVEMNTLKVFENVNNFGFGSEGLKAALLEDGPSSSWSGLKLTLDYTNVPGASGKIEVVFGAAPNYSVGMVALVTFIDYVNNGTAIDGKMKFTVDSFTAGQMAQFGMVSIGDLTVTEGGISYLWGCNQTIKWAEGNASDDSFLLNGSSKQTADSVVNTMELTDIVSSAGCDYIKDGVIVLVKDAEGSDPMEITCDFGVGKNEGDDGLCDGYVRITSGGLSLKIDLSE